MILWTGPFLPLAALIWPLLLAALTALPALRESGVRLLPFAPLPALWLALAGGDGVTWVPDLLLGVTLGLGQGARLLLGMTAVLWCIAGLAAQTMAGRANMALFSGFWGLTLTGNLAVFLAQDVVTFYVAFAAVSLAAWFLIVHDGTGKALHAGRVYITIAIAGEVFLLIGLLLGAHGAASMAIADVRDALGTGTGSAGPVAVAALIVGFGIKAGMVPLHVWLPLAHPAAPVPASAVLSGAIVKAGLIGLILFVPEGMFGPVLMGLGLAGAFGAALWGLTQANPKAVLAYSTISQMGLMIMLVGAGGAAREMAPFYALHHGLAKGALFLLVGVMLAAPTRRQRLLCLAVSAIVAASVAGFPLTGGALAKAAVKPGLPGAATLALSLSSVTTGLILVWFLTRLWRLPEAGAQPATLPRLSLPVLAGGLAMAAPWYLWQAWTGRPPDTLLALQPALDALWPLALALLLSLALRRRPLPERPPGDLLLLLTFRPAGQIRLPEPPALFRTAQDLVQTLQRLAARTESALQRWSLSGALLPMLVLLVLYLLS